MSAVGNDSDFDADDEARWRELTGTVTPLARCRSERVSLPRDPGNCFHLRAVGRIGDGPYVPVNTSKRVTRGKVIIDGRLDMHGLRADQAQMTLIRFVRHSSGCGHRCLLVITGKGRSGSGVLRAGFPEWLRAPGCRVSVSSYAPAHRSHGGEGAWYIFLRARRRVSPRGGK